MNVSPIDLLLIGLYFAGIVAFGLWLSRKQAHGGKDFFLAGRQMKWPTIGASLFATNISSQQFVGQAGLAFTLGIAAGAFQLVGAFCLILLAVVFLKTYTGLRLTTSPEFFERRYDGRARTIVSFINVMLMVLGNITAALYAGAVVLSELLGWSMMENADALFLLAVLLIGLAAGAYTLLGGLRAIMYLDFIQAIVLLSGGILLFGFGISIGGGFGEIFGNTATAGQPNLWNAVLPWDHPFGWLPMITGVVILGIHGHCANQDDVQRALAAQNLYHAQMGALLGALLKVAALFFIAAPGVIAARLVQKGIIEVPTGDAAYAVMVTNLLPVGLVGIALAGLLAAIMSSVDSGLCGVGSLITYDFVAKTRKDEGELKRLSEGRLIMVIVLVICIILAPLIRQFEGLFQYLVFVWSLLAPPVTVCVLFGLFDRRATARATFITLLLGIVLGLATFCYLKLPVFANMLESAPAYLQNKLNLSFLIAILCAGTMFTVSRLFPATETDRRKAAQILEAREKQESMTAREQVKFRLALAFTGIILIAVTILFSPLGIG